MVGYIFLSKNNIEFKNMEYVHDKKGDELTFFLILLCGYRVVFKVDVLASCTFENENVNISKLAYFCPILTKAVVES